jgi:transposase-like protein
MVTNTTATTELVETGEKRDTLGRRRTPAERRAELLKAYRASGLTQSAFAKREGLRYSTFCTWAQAEREAGRLPMAQPGRKRRAATTPAGVRFTEVKLSPMPATMAGGLEVRLPDGTLLRGGSAAELAKLVRALKT